MVYSGICVLQLWRTRCSSLRLVLSFTFTWVLEWNSGCRVCTTLPCGGSCPPFILQRKLRRTRYTPWLWRWRTRGRLRLHPKVSFTPRKARKLSNNYFRGTASVTLPLSSHPHHLYKHPIPGYIRYVFEERRGVVKVTLDGRTPRSQRISHVDYTKHHLSKLNSLWVSRGTDAHTQMSMTPTGPWGLDLFGISKMAGEIIKLVLKAQKTGKAITLAKNLTWKMNQFWLRLINEILSRDEKVTIHQKNMSPHWGNPTTVYPISPHWGN